MARDLLFLINSSVSLSHCILNQKIMRMNALRLETQILGRKIQCLCEIVSRIDKNGLGVLIYVTNFEPFGQQLSKGIAVSKLRGDKRWGPSNCSYYKSQVCSLDVTNFRGHMLLALNSIVSWPTHYIYMCVCVTPQIPKITLFPYSLSLAQCY